MYKMELDFFFFLIFCAIFESIVTKEIEDIFLISFYIEEAG